MQETDKVGKVLASKDLSEAVSWHQRSGDPVDFDAFSLCFLSNLMLSNVNMAYFYLYSGIFIIKYPNHL